MQRLQIVSPASTEHGKKADWPTSFDTDTRDGEAPGKHFHQYRVRGVTDRMAVDKESKGEEKKAE